MGKIYVYIPFNLFLGFIGMYLLGSTADAYLSPALETISDNLKMSQSLAGVTLLALGSGAPDVSAAYSAGGDENNGPSKAMTAIMGSTAFISCCIFYLVTKAAEGQQVAVTKPFYLRDVSFFLIGIVYNLINVTLVQ